MVRNDATHEGDTDEKSSFERDLPSKRIAWSRENTRRMWE
jgi:hypothetical protein